MLASTAHALVCLACAPPLHAIALRATNRSRKNLAGSGWVPTTGLKFKEPFKPEVFAKAEAKLKRQKLARLQNMAASLNYQLVPQP